MAENTFFFRNDQIELMAHFVQSLKYHGQRFKTENNGDGFYVIIY